MKKLLLLFLIIIPLIFVGCSKDTTGYSSELIHYKWVSITNSDKKASLTFSNNNANFQLENGLGKTVISGKCVVDEKTFVIFEPKLSRNYAFNYKIKGKQMTLTYNDSSLDFKILS